MSPLRKPPHEHTVEFLRALDPAKHFTFQTFREKGSEVDVAPKVIHSWPELLHEYELGAGIYVTVNETDLAGRKTENIKRVRAVWQEDDDGYDGAFPLAPSLIVESSPRHFHRYWLVADEWPADEQGRADFAAVMGRMVESYGSDKNAKDIARVLRVPGFLHRKGKPYMVRLIEQSGRRYSRAEVVAAFPKVEREQKQTPHKEWKPQGDDDRRITDALHSINADDRDVWLQCGMALKDHYGDSGRPLWDEWSLRSKKYEKREQDKAWRSFRRQGITIGTLYHLARQAGWKPERPTGTPEAKEGGSAAPPNAGGKQLVVHDADAVNPEAIDWLWPGRIAIGKTTLIGGDPGLGKSQLSIFIAATISQAGEWPCKEGGPPKRSVIMLSAEDGVADTIVPRLMAAGADRAKVKIITAVHEADGTGRRIFNLTKDLDVLEDLITKLGDVGLVIIDPVDAYIGGNVDSHKNAAVRAVLEPISELADRLGVAIVALTHFSKQLGGKAIYRFIGSIAHIGAARIAFAVVADPENEGRVLILHAKNNLAPPQKGLAFRIEQHLVKEGVTGSSVFFEREYVAITADEALSADRDSDTRSSTDEAAGFLTTLLAPGPLAVAEIEQQARAAGLFGGDHDIGHSKPFRSARRKLGVITRKAGMDDGWVWELPKVPPPTSKVPSKNRVPFEEKGTFEEDPTTKRAPSKGTQNAEEDPNFVGHLQDEQGHLREQEPGTVTGEPLGRMVANGFAISHSPEDRRPGPTCRVYVREIRHPAIKSGPDDDMDDFVAL